MQKGQGSRWSRSSLWLVPVGFGILSYVLGQDSSWDLRNYHLYNAYAFLNGRLTVDLAPAQMQSYFNPLLDVPYFVASQSWPAPLLGFLMGCLHGINFLLVLFIARAVVSPRDSQRLPVLLALVGCIGAGFLSELGNSMGDNTTSLLVLGGLVVMLGNWHRLCDDRRRSFGIVVGAGALVGAGVGFKLTNAIYLVGMVGACAVLPAGLAVRARVMAAFCVSAAIALAILDGYWWWKVWHTFGNPLFPQFNAIFQGPLAREIATGDTRWLPRSPLEFLLWPFLMTLRPERVGDSPLPQLIWGLLYAAVLAWGARAIKRRFAGKSAVETNAGDPLLARRDDYIVLFICLSFVTWMLVFGVYRYLIAAELLAPLALWVVLRRLSPAQWHPRLTTSALIASSVVVLVGLNTWGHAPWASKGFSVAAPEMRGTHDVPVLLIGGEPLAWMVPFLPPQARYASVASNFPESGDYVARVKNMVAASEEGGYGVILAHVDRNIARIENANRWVVRLGLGQGENGCARIRWLISKIKRWPAHERRVGIGANAGCVIGVRPDKWADSRTENLVLAAQAAEKLARYGLKLSPESCEIYAARIGAEPHPYQWCHVSIVHDGGVHDR